MLGKYLAIQKRKRIDQCDFLIIYLVFIYSKTTLLNYPDDFFRSPQRGARAPRALPLDLPLPSSYTCTPSSSSCRYLLLDRFLPVFGTVDTVNGWHSQVCPRVIGGINTWHNMRHRLSLTTVA